MFAFCAFLRKRGLSEQYSLRDIRAIWPFPSVVLTLGAWEFMGMYWVYTSFWSFAAHIRACNGFHVPLHNLIHKLISMLEAFFSLSSFITEKTLDVQISDRNIWTSTVFLMIKELRLKKASSIENSLWIRLCNGTWKPLHALIWAVNDKRTYKLSRVPKTLKPLTSKQRKEMVR